MGQATSWLPRTPVGKEDCRGWVPRETSKPIISSLLSLQSVVSTVQIDTARPSSSSTRFCGVPLMDGHCCDPVQWDSPAGWASALCGPRLDSSRGLPCHRPLSGFAEPAGISELWVPRLLKWASAFDLEGSLSA